MTKTLDIQPARLRQAAGQAVGALKVLANEAIRVLSSIPY